MVYCPISFARIKKLKTFYFKEIFGNMRKLFKLIQKQSYIWVYKLIKPVIQMPDFAYKLKFQGFIFSQVLCKLEYAHSPEISKKYFIKYLKGKLYPCDL